MKKALLAGLMTLSFMAQALEGEALARACLEGKGYSPDNKIQEAQAAFAACREQAIKTPRIIVVAGASLDACLRFQIALRDDGISTASDVASAVALTCEEEFETLRKYLIFSKEGVMPPTQADILQRRNVTHQIATPLVLEVRAAHRNFRPVFP